MREHGVVGSFQTGVQIGGGGSGWTMYSAGIMAGSSITTADDLRKLMEIPGPLTFVIPHDCSVRDRYSRNASARASIAFAFA